MQSATYFYMLVNQSHLSPLKIINHLLKKYFLIYKPFNVLSQFTKEHPSHITLRDAFPNLPPNVYSVGRLDKDSEGLLILTDDNQLKTNILDPKNKVPKGYLAQVEGAPTETDLLKLRQGIKIRINKNDFVVVAKAVEIATKIPALPERNPPIRFRQKIPTTWVRITISEGKNRQVRRMFAAINFPVLRLVRETISGISVEKVLENHCVEVSKKELDI